MFRSSGFVALLLLLFISVTNSSLAKDQIWSTYIESEGRFSLKYPNTWLLGDSFNETSANGLKFYIDSLHRSQLNEIMQVGIGHRDPSLSAASMNLTTTLRLDSVLFIKKFKDDLQNFSLLGQPDFSKYKIDGHRSFYFNFSFVNSNATKAGLFVATDIDGSIFYILFTPDEKEFVRMLPIVEKIISLVKIKNI